MMLSSLQALNPSPSPIILHLCEYCFKISLALANSSLVRPFQFDLLLLGRPGWCNRVGR